MKSKSLKITLEDLLDVLLSHGIPIQKIESIMVDLGIPSHYIEKALASIITIFPDGQKVERTDGKIQRLQVDSDVISQLREIRELMERICNKLSSSHERASGPART